MAPCIFITAWQRNRSNHIEFSHFIIAYRAQIGWFMCISWPLDIMMLITKRTECLRKFQSTILFQCTWQMKWSSACFYTASNRCAPLMAIVTSLKKKKQHFFSHNLILVYSNADTITSSLFLYLPIFSFSTLQLWYLLVKNHTVLHHLRHLAQGSTSIATKMTEWMKHKCIAKIVSKEHVKREWENEWKKLKMIPVINLSYPFLQAFSNIQFIV